MVGAPWVGVGPCWVQVDLVGAGLPLGTPWVDQVGKTRQAEVVAQTLKIVKECLDEVRTRLKGLGEY